MFKKGEYLNYNGRLCQVFQTQTDELIYICISKKPYTPPDTIWINMDEVSPTGICPNCGNNCYHGEYVHTECENKYVAYCSTN